MERQLNDLLLGEPNDWKVLKREGEGLQRWQTTAGDLQWNGWIWLSTAAGTDKQNQNGGHSARKADGVRGPSFILYLILCPAVRSRAYSKPAPGRLETVVAA